MKKNKKVLIVVSSLKNIGGAERSSLMIFEELKKKGYEVSFLTFYRFNDELKTNYKYFCFDLKYNPNMVIKFFRFFIYIPFLINNFHKKKDFNLVISNDSDVNICYLVLNLIKKNKYKLFTYIRYDLHSSLILKLLIPFYHFSDLIIVLTDSYKKYLERKFKRVLAIGNFLDSKEIINLSKKSMEKEFKFDKSKSTFISVGRIEKQKNFKLMIQIFKEVSKKNKNWELLIIGEGKEKNKIEILIKKYNLQENIFLIGKIKNVFPYLKNSNFFISTSSSEGFSRVHLEALYSKIPIITNNFKYGASEILEFGNYEDIKTIKKNKNGYLIPYNNKKLFIQLILKILNGEEKIQKVKSIDTRMFSKKVIMNKIIKVIEEAYLD